MAQDLRGIYTTKCRALGIVPNPAVQQRFSAMDVTRSHCCDLSGIPVDASFHCVLDVLVVATDLTRIVLNSANATDREVDLLVHHLDRAIGVVSIDVSNNPSVTDYAGQMFLDFVRTEEGARIVDLDVSGTDISRNLRQELSDAVDDNTAAAAADEDAGMLHSAGMGRRATTTYSGIFGDDAHGVTNAAAGRGGQQQGAAGSTPSSDAGGERADAGAQGAAATTTTTSAQIRRRPRSHTLTADAPEPQYLNDTSRFRAPSFRRHDTMGGGAALDALLRAERQQQQPSQQRPSHLAVDAVAHAAGAAAPAFAASVAPP